MTLLYTMCTNYSRNEPIRLSTADGRTAPNFRCRCRRRRCVCAWAHTRVTIHTLHPLCERLQFLHRHVQLEAPIVCTIRRTQLNGLQVREGHVAHQRGQRRSRHESPRVGLITRHLEDVGDEVGRRRGSFVACVHRIVSLCVGEVVDQHAERGEARWRLCGIGAEVVAPLLVDEQRLEIVAVVAEGDVAGDLVDVLALEQRLRRPQRAFEPDGRHVRPDVGQVQLIKPGVAQAEGDGVFTLRVRGLTCRTCRISAQHCASKQLCAMLRQAPEEHAPSRTFNA
eukprot:7385014-Prymnesium_polylepis.1